MKKVNWKDLLIRALKTFVQGTVAYLGYSLASADLTTKEGIKALAIGTLSAGASALMNFINSFLKKED